MTKPKKTWKPCPTCGGLGEISHEDEPKGDLRDWEGLPCEDCCGTGREGGCSDAEDE